MGTNSLIMNKAGFYGVIIALILTAYFLFMSLLSLTEEVTFRYLNGLILFSGLFYAIRKHLQDNKFKLLFLDGFKLGFLTSIVATALFGGFVFIYLSFLNPSFMVFLQENTIAGHYMNPYSATFIILIEGVISGVIMTLGIMQYYKRYSQPKKAQEFMHESSSETV